MDFKNLFLSFNGRIRRTHFWIATIILMVVNGVISSVFMGGVVAAAMSGNPQALTGALGGAGLIGCLLWLALLWPSLAVSVKRCHDRNKSGLWLILMYLACFTVIGALWPLIEL